MFHVGDYVTILDGSTIPNYGPSWVSGMEEYIGETRVITKIDQYEYQWCLLENAGGFIFDERGLVLADLSPVVTELGSIEEMLLL